MSPIAKQNCLIIAMFCCYALVYCAYGDSKRYIPTTIIVESSPGRLLVTRCQRPLQTPSSYG